MSKICLKNDSYGSVYPVYIFIICLAVAGFLLLVLGHVIEPFMNLMNSYDSTVSVAVSASRTLFLSFMRVVWPRGLLVIIFLGLSAALLMFYQKKEYEIS